MTLTNDEIWMLKALDFASKALNDNPREVPISALFVKNGELLAKSYNKTNATKCAINHAEMICLDQLEGKVDFSEVTLYVTVEPCIMCASALIEHGIGRIVYGATNDKFGGSGGVLDCFEVSNENIITCRPEIVKGVFKEEAVKLLQEFYERGNETAPKSHRKLQ